MEHKELSQTNAPRYDIRVSEHERALAVAHAYQAEVVLRLARRVATRTRAVLATIGRVYMRGLEERGDLVRKGMINML